MKAITIGLVAMMLLINIMIFTVTPAEAAASELNTMKIRMWARQAEGINDLFRCFKTGSDNKSYEDAIFKIVSAEINLLAYGVNPKNPNLVSRLAEGNGSNQTDPMVFTYRVLKEQIKKKTGFVPDPSEPFKNQNFRGITSTNAQIIGTIELTFDY